MEENNKTNMNENINETNSQQTSDSGEQTNGPQTTNPRDNVELAPERPSIFKAISTLFWIVIGIVVLVKLFSGTDSDFYDSTSSSNTTTTNQYRYTINGEEYILDADTGNVWSEDEGRYIVEVEQIEN